VGINLKNVDPVHGNGLHVPVEEFERANAQREQREAF
jgi:hypothetical protein